MSYSTIARIDYLERELEKELAKKSKLEAMPDFSEFEDDTVIYFKMRFANGGTTEYNYAMLKCLGLWYTTGPKSPKAYTDAQIREWLAGNEVSELWIASEWEQVF